MLAAKAVRAALLMVPGLCWSSALQTAVPLEPGKPVERELAGGQTHEYHLQLAAGQYLHVVVDQRGIDVVVTLFGPDGKKLAEVDSPNGTQGPEPVSVIAGASGAYRLKVSALEKTAPAGRYEAKVEELRPATENDRTRMAAQQAYQEAERLRSEGTAQSSKQAIEKYGLAAGLFRTLGDRASEATALNWMGLLCHEQGDNQKALEHHQQALPLRRAVGDRSGEAATLNNIGAVYGNLGENEKALEYYQQALPLLRAVGDRRGEAATLNNIGAVYGNLGENEKALEYYQQALPLQRAVGDRSREAAILNNIGLIYGNLGENQKALEYYQQALPLLRAVGDRRGEAATLNGIGAVYRNLGENQKALEYYQQALPLRRAVGDRSGEAVTLNNIGTVYGHLGENQKALEYYQQALPLQRAVGDRRGEAVSLNNIGAVHRHLRETLSAPENLERALALARSVGARDTEARALNNLALTERDRGNLDQARAHLEAALAITEALRSQVAAQELRASFLASVEGRYKLHTDLLMQLHKARPAEGFDALAFAAAERGRARSLLEMLREARAEIRQGVEPGLLEQERSLAQRLDAKADRLVRLLSGKPAEAQAAALKKEIGELETEYQQVQAAIRKSSPRYAAITQPQPLSLKEIQQEVLDAGTVLLEYSLGKERSYLFAVTPDSLDSFELAKQEEIEKAARRVYELLTARNRRLKGESEDQGRTRIAKAEAEYPAAAAALSKMVLAPAASLWKGKRLLVVADGALQYIPFAALAGGHEVVSAPSASVLALLRRETAGRKPAANTLAVLADPVFDASDPRLGGPPASGFADRALERAVADTGALDEQLRLPRLAFTRQEADSIHALAGKGAGLKALDFQANRATATSPELSRYRIVHFATHGLLNAEHPGLSGLVLSLVDEKGRPQNGFLKLADVYNLNLPAELIVLSACQTALGKEIRGEGLVGLTRGFMYAGAPRVVASLWKVDDVATALLMERFYSGMLKEGLRPAAALRRAQAAMSKQRRWSSPYYWAGFVLQGEWR